MKKSDEVFKIIGIIAVVIVLINILSYSVVGCVTVHDSGMNGETIEAMAIR